MNELDLLLQIGLCLERIEQKIGYLTSILTKKEDEAHEEEAPKTPEEQKTKKEDEEYFKLKTNKQKHPPTGAILLADLWNKYAHPSLPKVSGITASSARARAAVIRWKEKPNEGYWVGVIQRINSSDFLLGRNDKNWRADFEFFVRTDTHFKIIEGKYDNKKALQPDGPRVVTTLADGTPVYSNRQ